MSKSLGVFFNPTSSREITPKSEAELSYLENFNCICKPTVVQENKQFESMDRLVIEQKVIFKMKRDQSTLPSLKDVQSANIFERNGRFDPGRAAKLMFSPEDVETDSRSAAKPPLHKTLKNLEFLKSRISTIDSSEGKYHSTKSSPSIIISPHSLFITTIFYSLNMCFHQRVTLYVIIMV